MSSSGSSFSIGAAERAALKRWSSKRAFTLANNLPAYPASQPATNLPPTDIHPHPTMVTGLTACFPTCLQA